MLNVKQGGIKYHFLSLLYDLTWDWIPGLPDHWRTLCSKLLQKEYKTWHNKKKKLIHWELCKRIKFDHADKWYVYKQVSIQENEIQKIFSNLEIQITWFWPDNQN